MKANQIPENLFAQVNNKGNRFIFLDEIMDHRMNNDVVQEEDAFYIMSMGLSEGERQQKDGNSWSNERKGVPIGFH